jgi:hypothetical protein
VRPSCLRARARDPACKISFAALGRARQPGLCSRGCRASDRDTRAKHPDIASAFPSSCGGRKRSDGAASATLSLMRLCRVLRVSSALLSVRQTIGMTFGRRDCDQARALHFAAAYASLACGGSPHEAEQNPGRRRRRRRVAEPDRHCAWSYVSSALSVRLRALPGREAEAARDLPTGLQIVGRWLKDTDVLRLGAILERVGPWADRRPPL